jgi:hypothetical protein
MPHITQDTLVLQPMWQLVIGAASHPVQPHARHKMGHKATNLNKSCPLCRLGSTHSWQPSTPARRNAYSFSGTNRRPEGPTGNPSPSSNPGTTLNPNLTPQHAPAPADAADGVRHKTSALLIHELASDQAGTPRHTSHPRAVVADGGNRPCQPTEGRNCIEMPQLLPVSVAAPCPFYLHALQDPRNCSADPCYLTFAHEKACCSCCCRRTKQ